LLVVGQLLHFPIKSTSMLDTQHLQRKQRNRKDNKTYNTTKQKKDNRKDNRKDNKTETKNKTGKNRKIEKATT
jgi:hypothetical protein